MPSASNEPITTEARSSAIFGSSGPVRNSRQSFSRIGLFRPSRFSLAASKRNAVIAGKLHAVLHRDQLGVAIDFEILRRIDFEDVQIFVNRFRLDVVFRADLRRDFVPGGLRDNDANGLFAAAFHAVGQVRFPAWRGARK